MNPIKNIAYGAFNLVTLRKGVKRNVGGSELRFPPHLSRFYTSDYEPETIDYLRSELGPGDTFIDIGAHIGIFSVFAARLVGPKGRVVSFEPTPVTRKALAEVVRLNGFADVVMIQTEAISAERGEATFFDAGGLMSVTNSLIKNETSLGTIMVPTISLDEFVAESGVKPDCIKIDVEGGELAVLRGGSKTLRQMGLKIRLAVHPPFFENQEQNLDEIWRLMSDCGLAADFNGQNVNKEWFCSQSDFFDVNLSAPELTKQ